jgi:hypothetical protein
MVSCFNRIADTDPVRKAAETATASIVQAGGVKQ